MALFNGRYELGAMLGQGGFALVYRGDDQALGRPVAIKMLQAHLAADAGIRGRFLAEARAIARLRHPNILTVFDVGEAEGIPFYTMELIDGGTLQQMAADQGALPLSTVIAIARALGSALDTIHDAGMVHRDIKPANVMVDRGGRIALMDFGIARVLADAQQTMTGMVLGTPHYMAPEQVSGAQVGPAADVYSLGAMLYALLAGHPPFEGDTAALLAAHLFQPPPPLPQRLAGLPAHVAATIAAAMHKEPAQRPARAGILAAMLAGELPPPATAPATTPTVVGFVQPSVPAGETVVAAPAVAAETVIAAAPSAPQPARAREAAPPTSAGGSKKRWPLIVLGALAILAAAGGSAFALRHGRDAAGEPAPIAGLPLTPAAPVRSPAEQVAALLATPMTDTIGGRTPSAPYEFPEQEEGLTGRVVVEFKRAGSGGNQSAVLTTYRVYNGAEQAQRALDASNGNFTPSGLNVPVYCVRNTLGSVTMTRCQAVVNSVLVTGSDSTSSAQDERDSTALALVRAGAVHIQRIQTSH